MKRNTREELDLQGKMIRLANSYFKEMEGVNVLICSKGSELQKKNLQQFNSQEAEQRMSLEHRKQRGAAD